MMEAGVLIASDGTPVHWHLPDGRSSGYLPDSRSLWDAIWENRERVLGFAHSHPGFGPPAPSHEDITTFSAVERALGRRLRWWIVSGDCLAVAVWNGSEYRLTREWTPYPWIDKLREYTGYFR